MAWADFLESIREKYPLMYREYTRIDYGNVTDVKEKKNAKDKKNASGGR